MNQGHSGVCEDTMLEFEHNDEDINVTSVTGVSILRDVIVEEISANNLSRPIHNLQRNT